MKRIGAILMTVALIMMLSVSFCFADSGLTIENTYPKDGSTGASIENLGVKIHFSENMTEKVVGKANNGCFQLYDDEGRKLPTRVLYNDKVEGEVLVLLDTNNRNIKVEGNTEYALKISRNTTDDAGNTLGADQIIRFKTLNQSVNTMISMGMMVVMFGGIMVISARSAKKAAEEVKKQEKVNPYKESKKTGKSVEEIVEKDQKKKAKEAEKAAKKAAKEAEEYDDYEEDINKYRVSRRRSAGKAGSKYVAAKKAAAEAKKAQNAKKTANNKKKKK